MAKLDEYKRIQRELPSPSASLSLAMPMTASMRELSPEQLDVLQLVHNYGSLSGVLDHGDADDVTAAERVLSLLKKEYIRAG